MRDDVTDQLPPIGKLRWQCRRGMKELDMLFLHYLDHYYPQADMTAKACFLELVNTPDPQVMDYLHHRATPDNQAMVGVLNDMQTYRP